MAIGLALSGGGFRATLFHLGVISFLRDSGKLSEISHITSVSGGSILAAHLVLNWDRYTGDDDEFNKAATEIIDFVRADVRGRIYRRAFLYAPFRLVPRIAVLPRFLPQKITLAQAWRRATSALLINYYSEGLYNSHTLNSLQGSNRPQLYLLTTNLANGHLCSFTAGGFRNEDKRHESHAQTFPLSAAVAASSAFPGLFPPIPLTTENSGISSSDLGHGGALLTDGGVYDNLGIRKFHKLREEEKVELSEIIVSDASSDFKLGSRSGLLEPLRIPLRAADILSKRIHDMEKEKLKDPIFKLVRIGDSVAEAPLIETYQRELVSIRTDLDKFSDLEILSLVWHGYCVARSVAAQSSNESEPKWADKKPWDPVPESKDADIKAIKESNHEKDKSDMIRRKLDKSAYRKLRLFSFKDRISYFQLFMVLSLVLGYFYLFPLYRSIQDLSRSKAIDAQVANLRTEYVKLLSATADKTGNLSGYHNYLRKSGQSPLETWNTSQVAYALLKSSEITTEQRNFIIDAINSRFLEAKDTTTDWQPRVRGWYTRPTQKNLQAEPALWTAATIAVLLQRDDLEPKTRDEMVAHLNDIQKYLSDNKFYKISRDKKVAFNIFARQVDEDEHCSYSTTLALMTMLEIKRANLKWGDRTPEEMITGLIKWLAAAYEDGDLGGWRGIEYPDTADNRISDGFTLQTLATLLEAHKEMGLDIDKQLADRCRRHLLSFKSQNTQNQLGRTFLNVMDIENKQTSAETSITFIWRPWAIRLARLWLSQEKMLTSVVDKRIYRNVLYDLIVTEGQPKLNEHKNEDFTFKTTEMLIALSPIP